LMTYIIYRSKLKPRAETFSLLDDLV